MVLYETQLQDIVVEGFVYMKIKRVKEKVKSFTNKVKQKSNQKRDKVLNPTVEVSEVNMNTTLQ